MPYVLYHNESILVLLDFYIRTSADLLYQFANTKNNNPNINIWLKHIFAIKHNFIVIYVGCQNITNNSIGLLLVKIWLFIWTLCKNLRSGKASGRF